MRSDSRRCWLRIGADIWTAPAWRMARIIHRQPETGRGTGHETGAIIVFATFWW